KSDSDTYSCDIGDAQSRAKLTVQDGFYMSLEKPCVFTKELADTEVTEGEDVSLQCETSRPDSPEKWCKDGKSLRNSSKYNIRQSGFEAKLVIHRAEGRDS
ncbi:OBSCN protein, partial [Rhabdornis inornatus]|nr:OBSCN protein [Rhabdornis inornatus]